MPIHVWTRVRPNRFHHFHQTWTANLAAALNSARLPPGFFAMAELTATGREADANVIDRNARLAAFTLSGASIDVAPTSERFAAHSEAANYARKADRIAIRHPDGDVVAIIEIVSPDNKDSRHAIRAFARKSVEFLQAGIHRF